MIRKDPRVHQNFCPQVWGRKWLRQFYGRSHKIARTITKSFLKKTRGHCPIKLGFCSKRKSEKPFSVRKIRVRNSGAGKWLRQFYGRLEKCVLSAGKTHVHKIPRLRGGVFWVFGWGGVPILFLWARGFFRYELGTLMTVHIDIFRCDFGLSMAILCCLSKSTAIQCCLSCGTSVGNSRQQLENPNLCK